MKLFVISDIHGSEEALDKALSWFEKERAEYLVILGDFLNHAPRNALPSGYSQMGVAKKLNLLKDKIIGIKGNCDSEVDQEVLRFPLLPMFMIMSSDKKFFFTHGHIYNAYNLPPMSKGDVLVHGHYHIPWLFEKDGVLVASPGSIAIPRGDSKPAYIVIEDGKLDIKSLDTGESIKKEVSKGERKEEY